MRAPRDRSGALGPREGPRGVRGAAPSEKKPKQHRQADGSPGNLQHRERVDVDDDAAFEIGSVFEGGEQGAAHLATLRTLE